MSLRISSKPNSSAYNYLSKVGLWKKIVIENRSAKYSHHVLIGALNNQKNLIQSFEWLDDWQTDKALNYFYEFFEALPKLCLGNEKFATSFFQLILLHAIYIPPKKRYFYLFENGFNQISIIEYFKKAFVRYETPHWFLKNLSILTLSELKMLVHVLQGNNLRSFPSLTAEVSKKTSYFIMYGKRGECLRFENHFLWRAAIQAQFLRIATFPATVQEFLLASHEFQYELTRFVKDIDFWIQGYLYWEKHYRVAYFSINLYLEYCSQLVVNPNGISVFKRSFKRFANELDYWQGMQWKFGQFTQKTTWSKTYKAQKIKWKEYEFSFEELCTSSELVQESYILSHCVRSYVSQAKLGWVKIISVKSRRIETNTHFKFKRVLTLEIRGGAICQAAGYGNRSLTEFEQHIVRLWANQNNCIDAHLQPTR